MRDGAPGSSVRVQRRGVWGVSGDARCRVGKTDSDRSRHCYGDPGVSGQGRRLECGPRRKLAGLLCRWQFGRGLGSKLSIYDLSGDGLSIKADTEDQFIGGVDLGYNLQGAHPRLGRGARNGLRHRGCRLHQCHANFTISSLVNPPTKLSHEISEVAFVVGGGLDFKVLPRLSLGAEGLFYDFANDEAHLTAAGAPFLFHDHPAMTVVRGRITYYFNPSY
jgi:opacity protein-like surface antigen